MKSSFKQVGTDGDGELKTKSSHHIRCNNLNREMITSIDLSIRRESCNKTRQTSGDNSTKSLNRINQILLEMNPIWYHFSRLLSTTTTTTTTTTQWPMANRNIGESPRKRIPIPIEMKPKLRKGGRRFLGSNWHFWNRHFRTRRKKNRRHIERIYIGRLNPTRKRCHTEHPEKKRSATSASVSQLAPVAAAAADDDDVIIRTKATTTTTTTATTAESIPQRKLFTLLRPAKMRTRVRCSWMLFSRFCRLQ